LSTKAGSPLLAHEVHQRHGGERVDDQRRAVLVAQIVAQGDAERGVADRMRRPAAGDGAHEGDAPPDQRLGRCAATGDHPAHRLRTRRRAGDPRPAVAALHEEEIRRIDRRQDHLDQHLAVAKVGQRHLAQFQEGRERGGYLRRGFGGIAALAQGQGGGGAGQRSSAGSFVGRRS
jgi:hypothetical protein